MIISKISFKPNALFRRAVFGWSGVGGTKAFVYLHRVEGLLHANTHLMEQRDTYAVIVDGPVMYAYNIGGYPEPQCFLFDRSYYETLEEKAERFHYLTYACLGGESLPENTLIHLYDQHKKIMLEEFYLEELSL